MNVDEEQAAAAADQRLSKALRKMALRAAVGGDPKSAYKILLEAAGVILAEGLPGAGPSMISEASQAAPMIILSAALRHRERNPALRKAAAPIQKAS